MCIRRVLITLALIVALVLAAACGGEQDGSGSAPPTSTPAASAVVTTATTAQATATARSTATATVSLPTATATLAPSPTPTTTPTPTATVAATATTPPASSVTPMDPYVVEGVLHVDWSIQPGVSSSTVPYFGVLTNDGPDVIAPQITVTLHDAAGAEIGSDSTIVVLPAVAPGARTPFLGGVDAATSNVTASIDVQYVPFDPGSLMGALYNLDVEVAGIQWEGDVLHGEVLNSSDASTHFVTVLVAGYDGTGHVVWVGAAPAMQDEIAAGTSLPFTISSFLGDFSRSEPVAGAWGMR